MIFTCANTLILIVISMNNFYFKQCIANTNYYEINSRWYEIISHL